MRTDSMLFLLEASEICNRSQTQEIGRDWVSEI